MKYNPRTIRERTAQLGYILNLESEIMKARGEHGIYTRTDKAKKILWQYEINIFGCRACDLEFGYPKEWEKIPFTSKEYQGKEKRYTIIDIIEFFRNPRNSKIMREFKYYQSYPIIK